MNKNRKTSTEFKFREPKKKEIICKSTHAVSFEINIINKIYFESIDDGTSENSLSVLLDAALTLISIAKKNSSQ